MKLVLVEGDSAGICDCSRYSYSSSTQALTMNRYSCTSRLTGPPHDQSKELSLFMGLDHRRRRLPPGPVARAFCRVMCTRTTAEKLAPLATASAWSDFRHGGNGPNRSSCLAFCPEVMCTRTLRHLLESDSDSVGSRAAPKGSCLRSSLPHAQSKELSIERETERDQVHK